MDSQKEFQFTVTEEMEDERIDKCLNALMDSLSSFCESISFQFPEFLLFKAKEIKVVFFIHKKDMYDQNYRGKSCDRGR